MMMALRPLMAIIALFTGVAPGLVEGVTARHAHRLGILHDAPSRVLLDDADGFPAQQVAQRAERLALLLDDLVGHIAKAGIGHREFGDVRARSARRGTRQAPERRRRSVLAGVGELLLRGPCAGTTHRRGRGSGFGASTSVWTAERLRGDDIWILMFLEGIGVEGRPEVHRLPAVAWVIPEPVLRQRTIGGDLPPYVEKGSSGRMKGQECAKQEEAERRHEGIVPAAGRVDDAPNTTGEIMPASAKAEVHEAARGAGKLRGDVHRNGPDRRHDQLGEEECRTEAEGDRRQVLHEQDRQHEAEGAEKADHDDVTCGRFDMRPVLFRIRSLTTAADRVADDAGEEDARGEERRFFQVELVLVEEEGRDPVEEEPQRPAVAEVGQP